jgi:hypothetical protein
MNGEEGRIWKKVDRISAYLKKYPEVCLERLRLTMKYRQVNPVC